ncbi:MAG: transposase [Candidatus Aminicenantes bacterium]|nr:transposase [Candidatus Aminicenantes bacterium]
MIAIAIMIAYGVNVEGQREVLAVESRWDKTKHSWRDFMRKLRRRGAMRVKLFISDGHQGLQQAIKKEWLGGWQRCKVHFMRNILAKVASRNKARLAEKLMKIWLQVDRTRAEKLFSLVIEEDEKKYPETSEVWRRG